MTSAEEKHKTHSVFLMLPANIFKVILPLTLKQNENHVVDNTENNLDILTRYSFFAQLNHELEVSFILNDINIIIINE